MDLPVFWYIQSEFLVGAISTRKFISYLHIIYTENLHHIYTENFLCKYDVVH